jgi:hypothetical protein
MDGVFGVLLDEQDFPICVTLEESWLNNQRNISCVPEGTYQVRKYSGTRYKEVWKLENVPNRSAILIHSGNTEYDTEGCILVGSKFGVLGDKRAILNSRAALTECRKRLPDNFILKIEGYFD